MLKVVLFKTLHPRFSVLQVHNYYEFFQFMHHNLLEEDFCFRLDDAFRPLHCSVFVVAYAELAHDHMN